ncbi:MAG TPA: alpha/beta hydrolase [Rhizomicrobium sp.]|nr:alpha/beta hydrolase [Rhizomicrobium sp.]
MSDTPIAPPVAGISYEAGKPLFDLQANQGQLAALAGSPPPGPRWFTDAIAKTPEERFVVVKDARIHYLRWGDATKPGVLLVHGNAAHACWWSFIAPFLTGDYHVAAMDLSGMGDSDWRASDGDQPAYTMALFADEMLAVMKDAGMFAAAKPPVIVAHSFGGFVAMKAAADYGDRLTGIVIIDSPVNPPLRGESVRRSADHKPRPHNVYPSLAAALARFRLMPPQICENLFLLDWVARRSLKEVATANGDVGFTWKFDPAIWRHFSIGDTALLLKETRCRVAVFRGAHSVLMPPRVGDYIFDLLDRAAPVVEIPEAQHHIMLDQPLALVAALRALLADWEHSVATRRMAPFAGP